MEFKQVTDETILTEAEERARQRVCLAIDVGEPEKGAVLAKELSDFIGMAKIGGTLYNGSQTRGFRIMEVIRQNTGIKERPDGLEFFVDQKGHDTPGQVLGYAREACEMGVYMMTIHIAGGEAMCKAALQAAHDGAAKYGLKRTPKVVGVTVLTSLDESDLRMQGIEIPLNDLILRRAELAKTWGLDGIVCPANKAGAMEARFGPWLYTTPGIEFDGVQNMGQKQLYTPDRAVQDCKTSILVVGSAITKAGNVYENGTKILLQEGTSNQRRQTAYNILQVMAPHV